MAERAAQVIEATIKTLCTHVEDHAKDRSWRYANDAATTIWQLSRALKELPGCVPEAAPIEDEEPADG